MRRALQRRLIVTAMIAVTVLLAAVLGVVNGANWVLERQRSGRMLALLGESGGRPEFPRPEGPRPFWAEPISEDMALAALFFVVRLDGEGRPVFTDVSHIASVTREQAEEYAAAARQLGRQEGKTDGFRYRFFPGRGGGETAVFLSVAGQTRSILTVLALSLGAGAVCWGLMLLLVAALSRRAVAPIAESMERQKRFVTDAGHELKTPLAIILASTDALELHSGPSKWSRSIRAQAVRLDGLTRNLLTLARMEEGAGRRVQEVDLTALAENTADAFSPAAALREIRLEKDIQPQVRLRADPEHMERLLSILLDNGVRYTDPGGEILVRLRGEAGKAVLQVENTCAQPPEGDPERLFDRFYRGDGARTQSGGGYGIGLSAARAIAEAQGGSITAAYGKNGRVVFTAALQRERS